MAQGTESLSPTWAPRLGPSSQLQPGLVPIPVGICAVNHQMTACSLTFSLSLLKQIKALVGWE